MAVSQSCRIPVTLRPSSDREKSSEARIGGRGHQIKETNGELQVCHHRAKNVRRRLESYALRFALASSGSTLALLLPRAAFAESERPVLSLSWSAPSECPQRAAALALVADYLGIAKLATESPAARVLTANAVIRRRERGWELKLETNLDGEPGERTLSAATCADAAGAGALVLAFAIDPGAALRHGAAKPSTPPAAAPAPAVEAKAPPTPEATVIGAAAGVRGDWGGLPRSSVGVALSLVVERGAWSGVLSASAFAERSQATRAEPGAGGRIFLMSLAAAPCVALPRAKAFGLHVCLPVEVQRLRATGYGVDHPSTATRFELVLGAEVAPGVHLTRHLELILPLRLGVAVLRPEFYLEGVDSVFRASALQGRAGVGLLARF